MHALFLARSAIQKISQSVSANALAEQALVTGTSTFAMTASNPLVTEAMGGMVFGSRQNGLGLPS